MKSTNSNSNNPSYEPGDLVLGKCIGYPPWPAVIKQLKGYDEQAIAVYKVDFLGTGEWANLESNLLCYANQIKMNQLRNEYSKNKSLCLSLKKAEIYLQKLKEKVVKDPALLKKFYQNYDPEEEEQVTPIIQVQFSNNTNKTAKISLNSKQNAITKQNFQCIKVQPKEEDYVINKKGKKVWSPAFKAKRLSIQRSLSGSIQLVCQDKIIECIAFLNNIGFTTITDALKYTIEDNVVSEKNLERVPNEAKCANQGKYQQIFKKQNKTSSKKLKEERNLKFAKTKQETGKVLSVTSTESSATDRF